MNKTIRNLCGHLLLCSLTLSLAAAESGCSLIVINEEKLHGTETETVGTAKTEAVSETLPVTEGTETETDAEGDVIVPRDTASYEDKVKTADAYLAELREADYNGVNVLIAAEKGAAIFGSDGEGEDLRFDELAAIRTDRRTKVEEKYNVRFISFSYEKDEFYREITDAALSGTPYVADFFAITPSQLGRFQKDGHLLNLRSLPFTDYTKPYFNKKAMRELSGGYGVYGAVGDFTFAPENAYAIYFNKDILSALSLEAPYALVNDGSWTWDVFYTYAETAVKDGGIAGDNLSLLSDTLREDIALTSSGIHMVTAKTDAAPVLSVNTGKMQELADLVYRKMVKGTTAPTAAASARSVFALGSMLFYCAPLSEFPSLADAKANWGIVPTPKLSDTQSAYHTYTGNGAVICVPSVTINPDMTGTLLEALFAASSGCYLDKYLDTSLSFYVRDGETVDMLDLICDTFTYDFMQSFRSGYTALYDATAGAFHKTLTTTSTFERLYNANSAAAQKELTDAFRVAGN